jgi:AraC-like DNA-binding protein
MDNWKQPPIDPELAKYVDCYWYLHKSASDISHKHPKLNPSPDAHLILAPAGQPYHYTLSETDKQGCGSHLLLPNTRTATLHHIDPFVVLGIKFKVGALYSLAPTSNLPLLDDVVDAPAFLSGRIPLIPRVPAKATSTEAINTLRGKLDDWLRPLLTTVYEDKHSQLTRDAIVLLDRVDIEALSQQLHCSRRTIERSFKRVTGLTLKQYGTLQTLDQLLYYLYQLQSSPPNWADVAAKFGFSDQPHLIRYLKTAISYTPGDYLKQRDLTIDVYGDFE